MAFVSLLYTHSTVPAEALPLSVADRRAALPFPSVENSLLASCLTQAVTQGGPLRAQGPDVRGGAVTQGGQLRAQGLGVRGGGDSVARLGQISRSIRQHWLQPAVGSSSNQGLDVHRGRCLAVISQSGGFDVQWVCARCYQPTCDWLVMINSQR